MLNWCNITVLGIFEVLCISLLVFNGLGFCPDCPPDLISLSISMSSPDFLSSVLYPVAYWIAFLISNVIVIVGGCRSASSTIVAATCGVIGASISRIIARVSAAAAVVAVSITHVAC